MNLISNVQNTSVQNYKKINLPKQHFLGKSDRNSYSANNVKNKNKSERIKFSDIVIAVGALLGLAFVVTCGVLGTKKSKSPTYWGKFKDGCKEMWKTIKAILDSL
ncbi:hypothetical protein IKQ21_07130 [bacterium]|nr:hypothetical protein [bacterium]